MSCSDAAWRDCWTAFDGRAKKGEVIVRRNTADEVFSCAGRVSQELVIKTGRHEVRLRRSEFFNFLNSHGRECR